MSAKTDNYEKLNPSINRGSEVSTKKDDDFKELTTTEKIAAREKTLAEQKKKSMSAQAKQGNEKSFGLIGCVAFTIPRVWRGSCKQKMIVLFNFALVIVAKVIQTANPLFLMKAINGMICNPKKEVCPSQQEVYTYILIYTMCKFVYDIFNNLREVPYARMAANAEISIAHDVYDHIQRMSLAYHLSRETGKVIRIVSRGAQSFSAVLRMLMFNIFPIIVEVSLVLIVFAYLFPWQFSVAQFFALFVYVAVTYVLTERRAKGFKAKQDADNNYNTKATDSLLNFETVKYFNAEKHEEDRFEKALHAYKMESIKVAKSLVGLNNSQSLVINAGLCLTLSLAYYFFLQDVFNVGDFVMFVNYNQQIYSPLSWLGSLWRWMRQSLVDVEQILNILQMKEFIKEPENPEECMISKGRIEFKDVSFSYDQKLEAEQQTMVIEKISFIIEAGQSVGIVGQTGSGKSTIMRLLYRFYDISDGQILIDGQDIRNIKTHDLRNKIGIVPQDCVLFNDTILYNIAYGALNDKNIAKIIDNIDKSNELIDMIIPAAKRSSIHQFIMKLKMGYWEKVGERGLKLSGGEKQRVAIARCLLKKTPIMMFDEATSALDNDTEKQIQTAINEVSAGSTSLIIAHRLSTVRNCDKIIVLKHGVIVEIGSHDELLTAGGYYSILWNKQTEQQERMAQEAHEKKLEKEEYEQVLAERKKRHSFSKQR